MFPVYEQKKENVHILQKTSRHAPPHLHNSVEFIYVISGSMEIGMGQELFHMDEGDFAVIFPDVMLSDNMQNSIERWKRAYGQVTEKEIKKLEMEKALKKLLEDFFYVWNFRVLDTAFVREFLKHKNDDRYKRAMIVLIELMDKETKYFPELTKREANIWLIREIRDADEMIEINAYLGMLRNHLRRKEILGF